MKRVLFWLLFVPLAVVVIISGSLSYFDLWMPIDWVFNVILDRFEYWCFDVPRDYAFNSPFKRTLREEYANAKEMLQEFKYCNR